MQVEDGQNKNNRKNNNQTIVSSLNLFEVCGACEAPNGALDESQVSNSHVLGSALKSNN